MAATKITSAIKASTTGPAATAATYNDLPASAADGSLAQVTTTKAAGHYVYVASVDGFTVGKWFPSEFVVPGLVYAKDAGSKPARVSVGIGGDTLAVLTAAPRGWTDSSGTGNITDGSGYLIFNSGTTAFGSAQLSMTLTTAVGTDVFGFIEWETNTVSAANPLVPAVYFHDNTKLMRLGNSVGASNRHACTDGVNQIGAGGQTNSAFTTLFFSGHWGGVVSTQHRWEFWEPNGGREMVLTASNSPMASCNRPDWPTVSASSTIVPIVNTRNTTADIGHIKEIHLFEVG